MDNYIFEGNKNANGFVIWQRIIFCTWTELITSGTNTSFVSKFNLKTVLQEIFEITAKLFLLLYFDLQYFALDRKYCISEVESRTQGSRPRPRTQKKSEAKASLSEDRHSRGQGQECSRPRPRTKDTSASALQKKKGLHKNFSGDLKKKKSSQKFFKRSPQKNVFQKIFQALHKILTIQKILLSSSRGQANFRGLEASRPRPRT